MKLLLVAMSDSIHTARWIKTISGRGVEVYLFPSQTTNALHPNVKVKHFYSQSFFKSQPNFPGAADESRLLHIINVLRVIIVKLLDHVINLILRKNLINSLVKVITDLRPDIIHSLEIQSAGYLVNEVKKIVPKKIPRWIVSNWGSDIYYFGKDPTHAHKITDVLHNCNYYLCECQRDVKLARRFGFQGEVLSVLPNAGGYDLRKYCKYGVIEPSKRKAIMIKGYQGWTGRSLVALQALDSLGEVLSKNNYYIILYSTAGNTEVEKTAISIAQKHNLKLKLIPQFTSHEKIIKLHALSRISIGLSMSDGISTSLLESMLTGSFPIQSYTACADEWVVDGHTGLLVPPENVAKVKSAILKAIKDDQLVDKAAILNRKTIHDRASYDLVRKQAIELYNNVLRRSKKEL